MKFILEIELGNDAMQTGEDIARALMDVAKDLMNYGIGGRSRYPVSKIDGRKIMDENGNSVGKWEVVDAD